ncbi:MAG: lamin tail domain-containing protein [Proteobacteria bacterium]|nr:lamin tail domain-containing protein [Pseudomonadota bacterium]
MNATWRSALGLIGTLLGALLGGGCASDFWLLPIEDSGVTAAADLGRAQLSQAAGTVGAGASLGSPSAGGGWWSDLGGWPDVGVGEAGARGPRDGGVAPPMSPDGAAEEPRAAGDLIFTEWMQNPELTTDNDGEWVELFNPAFDRALTLRGCVLHDGGLDRHAIMAEVLVAPRGFVVLAASAAALGERQPAIDYVYSGFVLSNSADELMLSCGGQVIDTVVYGGVRRFPNAAGASVSLDPAAFDALANDEGARWCVATSVYRRGTDGQGDRGTPGMLNDRCAVPVAR